MKLCGAIRHEGVLDSLGKDWGGTLNPNAKGCSPQHVWRRRQQEHDVQDPARGVPRLQVAAVSPVLTVDGWMDG